MLVVIFDPKVTFGNHLYVARTYSQRFFSMRESWRVFYDRGLILRYFCSFDVLLNSVVLSCQYIPPKLNFK